MKLLLLIVIAFFCQVDATSQSTDFVVVSGKKGNVKTLFKGSKIDLQTTSGRWVSGQISDIRNDSIFYREVYVRQVPTQFGVYRLDTSVSALQHIHYNEIAALPRANESFGNIKDGTLLMIGGAGYVLLNVVNGAYLNYPLTDRRNLGGLLAAAGVFGLGKLMHTLRKPYLMIGKRYQLRYIKG